MRSFGFPDCLPFGIECLPVSQGSSYATDFATKSNFLITAQQLLSCDRAADINLSEAEKAKNTALHYAAQNRTREIVLLVEENWVQLACHSI
jgi:hypothetical protein